MGCIGCLSRLIAFFLLILFVILMPIGTWGFHLERMLMDKDTYLEPLSRYQIYARLPAQLISLLASSVDDDGERVSEMLSHLSESDMNELGTIVVPEGWIREQVEANVEALFLWLGDVDSSVPDLILDLRPVRNNLLSERGVEAVNMIVMSWPDCDERQLAKWQMVFAGRKSDFPFCEPSPEMMSNLQDEMPEVLVAVAEHIPDKLTLRDYLIRLGPNDEPSQREILRSLKRIKLSISAADRLFPLLFMVPVGVLAAIVMVAVRSAKAFFIWIGWSLMLAGLLTLALPIALTVIRGKTLEELLIAAYQTPSIVWFSLTVQGILHYMIEQYIRPILVQAIIMTVVGFAFVLVGSLLHSPTSHKPMPNSMKVG